LIKSPEAFRKHLEKQGFLRVSLAYYVVLNTQGVYQLNVAESADWSIRPLGASVFNCDLHIPLNLFLQRQKHGISQTVTERFKTSHSWAPQNQPVNMGLSLCGLVS